MRYTEEDARLHGMLDFMDILDSGVDPDRLPAHPAAETFPVSMPDDVYGFLHEAAVIEHRGTLYASWYNCPATELMGRTPIRGRRSRDGGRTWSDIEVIADDPTGKILYCPPVYGVCGGRLYLLLNEMVSADHMHALDLYVLNEETDRFEFLRSHPLPFKLNTNVYTLPDGRLLLPGRIAEPDGFPNTPAVLLSDTGKIDAPWRLVRIAENGTLPDGSELVHPELSAVVDGERVYIFCRDDNRNVPLLYLSEDGCETWRGPIAHNIPFSSSKIYSGTLSDGRHYAIGNLDRGRQKLAIFFSAPGEFRFTEGYMLQDGVSAELGCGARWHYPVCHEADGFLYIIYTVSVADPRRGAVLTRIPLF